VAARTKRNDRYPCMPTAATVCAVVIEPTTAGDIDYLNINEIQVFPAGSTSSIPLTISMSSQYNELGENLQAANCIDGNWLSTCSTYSTLDNDTSPWLKVTYSCPSGQVEPGTKVVVTNRGFRGFDPGLESRLSKFTLHFHNSTGRIDGASYSLAGGKVEYSFTWLREYHRRVACLFNLEADFQILASCIHLWLCR
jgi:hypothetical protein